VEKLLIATRSSPLAMWQAEAVAALLDIAGFRTELLPLETKGDKKLEVSLAKIGEKGLFTAELEDLLLRGEAHLAVHSAKDMPSQLPEGLEIIALTERENPEDVLVSYQPGIRLSEPGIRVGTSSTRRVATLARYFPTAVPVPVRGNLQTRFRKMQEGHCDAMILARAGVVRMGLAEYIRESLPADIFTPAAGQASLAIEAAENLSPNLKNTIRTALNHPLSEACIISERTFLRKMEGGCSIPVFALCRPETEQTFLLEAGIISTDGKLEVRKQFRFSAGPDYPHAIFRMAGENLASLVLGSGGSDILEKIKAG
jgi:hydroxymethylbilane synthase